MGIALWLVLTGLLLVVATLCQALHEHSRAGIARYVPEANHRKWFERLDRHEGELQGLFGFLRQLIIGVLVVHAFAAVLLSAADPTNWIVWIQPAIILAVVFLVFGAGVPTALALHAGDLILARALPIMWAARFALYPIERLMKLQEFLVRRLLGRVDESPEEESERHEKEILEAVSEGELFGALDEEQRGMIEAIFELSETTVAAIMQPRTDIVAIPLSATFHEACKTITEAGHSRVPVFEDTMDHIVGVLYAKDLLGLRPENDFDMRAMMRTVPYVPETKTIDHLLRELRTEKVHMAIVLDEYGGTAGLVTIEDILEELVGEIVDEYDQGDEPTIDKIDPDTLEVDARVHVDEVNEALAIELPENGDYETIGGFVFTVLGRIPEQGEEFSHGALHVRVLDAEPRKINRLRLHVQRDAAAQRPA